MNNTSFFKLFACCFIVKGTNRCSICDVHKNSVQLIPNDLYEILHYHNEKSISQIKHFYKNRCDEIIDEYFTFLIENDYCFLCTKEELELFPPIKLDWEEPYCILNAIIDFDEKTEVDFKELIKNILLCKNM